MEPAEAQDGEHIQERDMIATARGSLKMFLRGSSRIWIDARLIVLMLERGEHDGGYRWLYGIRLGTSHESRQAIGGWLGLDGVEIRDDDVPQLQVRGRSSRRPRCVPVLANASHLSARSRLFLQELKGLFTVIIIIIIIAIRSYQYLHALSKRQPLPKGFIIPVNSIRYCQEIN
jgi:hypothetical protein